MANLMDTYKGQRLQDLVGTLSDYLFNEKTYAIPAAKFGDEVVTEADVIAAFPPDLLGIINASTIRLKLVSDDTVSWLEE